MSLADFKPELREVAFKGGSFNVQAVTLSTLSILLKTHFDDLDAIFTLWNKKKATGLDKVELETFVGSLLMSAPGLAANIIAVGAGEDDATEIAKTLPVPVQAQALMDIATLTFSEVGSVKKLWEGITTFLDQNGIKVPTIPSPIPTKKKKAR